MSKMATLGLGYASTAPKRSSHERREPSGGAFTMFTPQQVKQFKEAFNMIDQDGDGRISEDDLKVMLSNLGGSGGTKSCTLLTHRTNTFPGVAQDAAHLACRHDVRRQFHPIPVDDGRASFGAGSGA